MNALLIQNHYIKIIMFNKNMLKGQSRPMAWEQMIHDAKGAC